MKLAKSQEDREEKAQLPLGVHVKKGLREGALLILLAVAIYFLISLFTYNPADPGWTHSGASKNILNTGGLLGAWAADISLYLFGFLAYLFPLMVAYSGWLIHRWHGPDEGFHWGIFSIRWLGFFITLAAGTGLAAIHHDVGVEMLPLDGSGCDFGNAGGILGCVVSSSLDSIIGVLGATLLLLALTLGGITLFTGLSWIALSDLIGSITLSALGWCWNAIFRVKEYFEVKRIQRRRTEVFVENKKEKSKRRPPKIKNEPKIIETSERDAKEKQMTLFDAPTSDGLPVLSLLDEAPVQEKGYTTESLEAMSRLVEHKLKEFGVIVEVVAVHPGPVITRYELKPAIGVKVSQITNLSKDLARALSAISVRVVDVIPGKEVVGLEIPNEHRQLIALSEITRSREYDKSTSPLTVALGKDISGQPVVADLSKMPHLLVAGTTGSGKSVGVNAMIISLLYKSTPQEVKLIMIDPKMLELSVYDDIPHLLTPVVTDMKEAAHSLRWCVGEMERRYKLMAALGVRNIGGFNRKVQDAIKDGNPIRDPLFKPSVQIINDDGEVQEIPELKTFPFIVVIIDEFADMMMVVGKKVEELIARLAQKARAAGIHLVLATQRPSVDVITGLIKANIPTRIAFQVSSKIDSRTILDQMGAEQLLGHGDMLYLPPGTGSPVRVHGAFVSDQEVHKVVGFLKEHGAPDYIEGLTDEPGADAEAIPGMPLSDNSTENDPLYDQAVRIVTETRKASISGVQRRLKIGYNRAARLVEQMESVGLVGPLESNGSREVLAPPPPSID